MKAIKIVRKKFLFFISFLFLKGFSTKKKLNKDKKIIKKIAYNLSKSDK